MKPKSRIARALLLPFVASLILAPEAQAFRGRGAAFVVGAAVGSANASEAEASAAASQQQAAAAQQQAAAAQQQAAEAQQQLAAEKEKTAAAEKEAAAARQHAAAAPAPRDPREVRCRWGPWLRPFPPDALPLRWAA